MATSAIKIIISTPNGYLAQTLCDKNPLQQHKSGWTKEDFITHGFRVYGLNGFKIFREERGKIRFKPKILFVFLSVLSRFIVYFIPEYAFQLLCIKCLKKK